jgi:plastocyanin
MAAFLNRALSFPPGAGDSFTDDDGSVFEGDIERLAASGVTRGCNPPDNTLFCPDDSVTRGQMAAFLVRAFGYEDGAGSDRFSDDDVSVFEADIERLAAAGVTLGCNPPDNTLYCPDQDVTRAQMATFLGRALGLTPDTPPPATTSTTSGDSTSTTDDGSSTSTTEDDGSTTTTAGQTTTTAGSSDVVVLVGNNFFDDDSVTISGGDTVTFSKPGSGNHNVDFANNSIPDSIGPTTNPFNHPVTFNSVGTFSYVCDIHVGVGMDGTVTVE